MWGDYVGKKSLGHAAWFKLYANQHGAVLDAVSDADAGQAVKAALKYLETGIPPNDLQGCVAVVFAALRPSVEEADRDYRRKSEGGKAGNRKRWQDSKLSGIGVRYQPTSSDRMVSHGIEKIEDRGIYPSKGDISPNIQDGKTISTPVRLNDRPAADEDLYDKSWMQRGDCK